MPDAVNPAEPARAAPARIAADGAGVLAVGLGPADLDGVMAPPPRTSAFARFAEVTPGLVAQLAPDVVIAPLFGRGFDIVDIAARLAECGFAGRLYALSPPLPRPEAVRAEVAEQAPGMTFGLVVRAKTGG